MAVAHDAASESHAGATGSTSEASFSWTHTPVGVPRGILVFVLSVAVTEDAAKATSVTYGGVTMQLLNARATDTSTEPATIQTFFLGDGIPTGAQTVQVNRTNDATVVYATAASVTAAGDTWVFPTWDIQQEDAAIGEVNVTDTGLSGTDSMRYAAAWDGHSAVPAAGANSTSLTDIDFGTSVFSMVRETSAGTGSRAVGWTTGTSDDRAVVSLAIEERPNDTVMHEVATESHLSTGESVSEASYSWTHPGGKPKGVTVVCLTRANATAVDTAVSYGGSALSLVSALSVQDTAGEPGRLQIWHLGSNVPQGSQTVVVTRTNNANPSTSIAFTVRADRDTEIETASAVLVSGDGTLSEQSVGMTASRGNATRYGAVWHGASPLGASTTAAGANSKMVMAHQYSLSGMDLVCERIPGTGSRSVGVVYGSSDDRAAAHFAVQQVARKSNAIEGRAALRRARPELFSPVTGW